MEPERVWFVYLLRCSDQTLYAGITTDVHRRMLAHETGKGAKYTRGRGPVELVGRAGPVTRTLALQWERELKRQPTHRKAEVLARWAQVCESERARVPED